MLSPSSVHNLSFSFGDTTARQFFNVVDAVQRGTEYATLRRDPRETDTLGQVPIAFQTVTTTFYDPIYKAIRIQPADAMNDFAMLHEYGHYLEERISGFVGIPAVHDGCTAIAAGVDVMDPGYAWMEGFAEYFSRAVVRSVPAGTLNGSFGYDAESPSCPPTSKPRASIEKFVAAALNDLMDEGAEAGDGFCSAGAVAADRLVFQIFDHELDLGFANPSLQHFVDAWRERGLDVPMLQRNLAIHGMTGLTFPASSTRYDFNPAANVAVWRPSTGEWFVAGGLMGLASWGMAGDVPVPADYDGDGITDIAVWRPSDGNWFVINSGSNRMSIQQWGTAGDIPLPGDYDGDNEIDVAVYRPSDRMFYLWNDGCGDGDGVFLGTGLPLVGDFDGDGRDDPGVYDASTGRFTIRLRNGTTRTADLPNAGVPAVGDFDGDGLADYAIYTPGSGWWYWLESATPTVGRSFQLGTGNEVAAPADFDGNGTTELATFNAALHLWKIHHRSGANATAFWGEPGDVPVPAP